MGDEEQGHGDDERARAEDTAVLEIAEDAELSGTPLRRIRMRRVGLALAVSLALSLAGAWWAASCPMRGSVQVDTEGVSEDGRYVWHNTAVGTPPMADIAFSTEAAENADGTGRVDEKYPGCYVNVIVRDLSGRHPGEISSGWVGPVTLDVTGSSAEVVGACMVGTRPAVQYAMPRMSDGQIADAETSFEYSADGTDEDAVPLVGSGASGWVIPEGCRGGYVRAVVTPTGEGSEFLTGDARSAWVPVA